MAGQSSVFFVFYTFDVRMTTISIRDMQYFCWPVTRKRKANLPSQTVAFSLCQDKQSLTSSHTDIFFKCSSTLVTSCSNDYLATVSLPYATPWRDFEHAFTSQFSVKCWRRTAGVYGSFAFFLFFLKISMQAHAFTTVPTHLTGQISWIHGLCWVMADKSQDPVLMVQNEHH